MDFPTPRLLLPRVAAIRAPQRRRTLIIRRIAEAASGVQAPWLALPWILSARLPALEQRTPFEAACAGDGQRVLEYLARRSMLRL